MMRYSVEPLDKIDESFLKSDLAIFFDFDGVFTDNKVYVSETGVEMVRCTRADGIGLEKLREAGVQLAVISTEINPVVSKRCEKLKIDCFQGINNKGKFLQKFLLSMNPKSVKSIFVGNDENDISAANVVDSVISVADSEPRFKSISNYQTNRKGGDGAVREICDYIYMIRRED